MICVYVFFFWVEYEIEMEFNCQTDKEIVIFLSAIFVINQIVMCEMDLYLAIKRKIENRYVSKISTIVCRQVHLIQTNIH